METIIWLKELTRQDLFRVGKKAVEINDLTRLNINVPSGFVVSGLAFKKFLENNNINSMLMNKLKNINIEDKNDLEDASFSIQSLFLKSEVDGKTREEILEAYDNLNINPELFREVNQEALNIIRAGKEHPFVVLRANFTEDFYDKGFNLFNIKGNNSLMDSIKKCWASMFTPDSISNIIRKNTDLDNLLVSVIVQKQILSTKSGIILNKEDTMEIEGGFGMSDIIISEKINYDTYVVEKQSMKVIDKKVNRQEFHNVLDVNLGQIMRRSLSDYQKSTQKLTDYEMLKLAEISRRIEQSFSDTRDIEFAIEGSNIMVMQTKPSGTFRKKEIETQITPEEPETRDSGDIPLLD